MGTARQQRSQRTLRRIVEATERLLEQRLFDEISVAAIVREADATVGSFYNLLDDKESLLPFLYQNHCEQLLARYDALQLRFRNSNECLSVIVSQLVQAILKLNQQQRGLLRALVLRAHCRASGPPDRSDRMTQVLPGLVDLVLQCRSEIQHPRPRIAARLGLLAVLSTVREVCLYPHTSASSLQIREKELPRELTRLWLGYLTTGF